MKVHTRGLSTFAALSSPGLRAYVFIGAGLAATTCSFFFAGSGLSSTGRLAAYAAIVTGYLALCGGYLLLSYTYTSRGTSAEGNIADLDAKLFALENIQSSLAASVNSPDAFRLLCSRINEIVEFDAAVLFAYKNDHLSVIHNYGVASSGDPSKVSALKACRSRTTVIGRDAVGGGAVAAIPLFRSGSVFAVLQVSGKGAGEFAVDDHTIFDAIGERISGFVAASFSLDQSRSDALTDPVTRLPNERAFMIVLENQIAQSLRDRGERPLVIVSIDVKNFDEVGMRSGHAASDQLLDLVADTIKEQLRQMDFVARASDHEFLAILPLATVEVAESVIDRIGSALSEARLRLESSNGHKWHPELCFGVASLIADGETIASMLEAARARRRRSTMNVVSRVAVFPATVPHI